MKLISEKVEIVDTSPNNPIAIMPLRISSGRGSRDVFEYAEAIDADVCQCRVLNGVKDAQSWGQNFNNDVDSGTNRRVAFLDESNFE